MYSIKNQSKETLKSIEEIILDLLIKYGALPQAAITKYVEIINSEANENAVALVIKRLISTNRLFPEKYLNDTIIKSSGSIEYDRRFSDSFWILLDQLRDINKNNHFKATYPSDIFFIDNKKQFEIMSPQLGNEFQISILKNKNNLIKRDEDKISLILGILNEEQLNECISYCDDMDVKYAQVIYSEGSNIPKINNFNI